MHKIKLFISKLIFDIKRVVIYFYAFGNDYIRYLKYSLHIKIFPSIDDSRTRMMLLMHALEKGLVLQSKRSGYGRFKGESLLNEVNKFLNMNQHDEVSKIAIGVLYTFSLDPLSGKSNDFQKKIDRLLSSHNINITELNGGIKNVSKELLPFPNDFNLFYNVAFSRSSVREFSNEEVTIFEINQAVKYAQTSPSVCNRQTSRIHIFSRDDINAILMNQLGDQGWANKANKLIVITSDLNYFSNVYERNQAFIDGGMFAMQFVMGLHIQKIASCCKMYVRTPSIDKDFYKLTKIKKSEVPIMLILVGHYNDKVIKVPYSFRLATDNIIKIHD